MGRVHCGWTAGHTMAVSLTLAIVLRPFLMTLGLWHIALDNITGEYHGTRFLYVGQFHHMGCVLGFDIPVAQFSHLYDFPSSDQEDEREGAREEKNESPIAELSISSPALSQGTRLSARYFVLRTNG